MKNAFVVCVCSVLEWQYIIIKQIGSNIQFNKQLNRLTNKQTNKKISHDSHLKQREWIMNQTNFSFIFFLFVCFLSNRFVSTHLQPNQFH